IAIGAVLEAHGARQPGSQLAVNLAFGRARPDGAPGHQVGNVLGGDHVEEFAAGGQALAVDVEQQFARHADAAIDVETAVQARVVDQPFPAHGGTRFFEIYPHYHFQLALQAVAHRLQAPGVFQRGPGVVDGARPDDHDQAVVHAVQDAVHALARGENGFGRLLRAREFAHDVRWWVQLFDFADAKIVGIV